jgi:hypothetical protein
MERRRFLTGLLGSLTGYLLAACGSTGSGGSSGGGGTANNDCSDDAIVSFNNTPHAHTTISLTASQITAAVPGTYTLLGGGHSHTFTLTGPDFTTLSSGSSISKSDLEAHGHTITVQC